MKIHHPLSFQRANFYVGNQLFWNFVWVETYCQVPGRWQRGPANSSGLVSGTARNEELVIQMSALALLQNCSARALRSVCVVGWPLSTPATAQTAGHTHRCLLAHTTTPQTPALSWLSFSCSKSQKSVLRLAVLPWVLVTLREIYDQTIPMCWPSWINNC